MSQYVRPLLNRSFLLSAFAVVLASSFSSAQSGKTHPWSTTNLPPDERASMVVKEMTLDEKILLLHGTGMPGLSPMSPLAVHSNGGAGYASGIQRLGIPAIQMSDAAYGVRMSGENGRYSTALPANVAGAASWDPEAAYAYGGLNGGEPPAPGLNIALRGGGNNTPQLPHSPQFRYIRAEPLLSRAIVGQV